MADASEERPEKEFGHAFFQQKLWHAYAQISPQAVILCLFIVAIVFIPIGAATIIASDSVFELDIRYDKVHEYTYNKYNNAQGLVTTEINNVTSSMGTRTNVVFTLDQTLVAPVYIYYRLVNFHQNYRLFGKSFSESQLYGSSVARTDLSDCNPYAGPNGATSDETITVDGVTSKVGDMIYAPCGAVPWSKFNDTLSLYSVPSGATVTSDGVLPTTASAVCLGGAFKADGTPLVDTKCEKKGIAFSQDRESRFQARPTTSSSVWTGLGANNTDNVYLKNGWYNDEPGHAIPYVEDEDLMVWSRIAPLADFWKLYRKVNVDLVRGTYVWQINEFFDITSLEGEKHVILATTSWAGGKNHVLGALYAAMGSLSLVLAFGFLGMHFARDKQ